MPSQSGSVSMTKRITNPSERKPRSHKDWRNPNYRHGFCTAIERTTIRAATYRVWLRIRIKGCSKYWDTFENFIADVGMMPQQGMTLLRINPEWPYDRFNCAWGKYKSKAPPGRVAMYTFEGRTMRLQEWANEYGVSRKTMWKRFSRTKTPLTYHRGKKFTPPDVVDAAALRWSIQPSTVSAHSNESTGGVDTTEGNQDAQQV